MGELASQQWAAITVVFLAMTFNLYHARAQKGEAPMGTFFWRYGDYIEVANWLLITIIAFYLSYLYTWWFLLAPFVLAALADIAWRVMGVPLTLIAFIVGMPVFLGLAVISIAQGPYDGATSDPVKTIAETSPLNAYSDPITTPVAETSPLNAYLDKALPLLYKSFDVTERLFNESQTLQEASTRTTTRSDLLTLLVDLYDTYAVEVDNLRAIWNSWSLLEAPDEALRFHRVVFMQMQARLNSISTLSNQMKIANDLRRTPAGYSDALAQAQEEWDKANLLQLEITTELRKLGVEVGTLDSLR